MLTISISMKKILFILLIAILFMLSLSFASAKEDTHIEMEKSTPSAVKIMLKDSSGNPVPGEKFHINITKPNGYTKVVKNSFNSKGECEYFLGLSSGQYRVSVIYKGSSKYNPCELADFFSVTGKSTDSTDNYYDHHNYGENSKMDDYIYDNYWPEEIYDDARSRDGEWY